MGCDATATSVVAQIQIRNSPLSLIAAVPRGICTVLLG
jgi:hypothetical protein